MKNESGIAAAITTTTSLIQLIATFLHTWDLSAAARKGVVVGMAALALITVIEWHRRSQFARVVRNVISTLALLIVIGMASFFITLLFSQYHLLIDVSGGSVSSVTVRAARIPSDVTITLGGTGRPSILQIFTNGSRTPQDSVPVQIDDSVFVPDFRYPQQMSVILALSTTGAGALTVQKRATPATVGFVDPQAVERNRRLSIAIGGITWFVFSLALWLLSSRSWWRAQSKRSAGFSMTAKSSTA